MAETPRIHESWEPLLRPQETPAAQARPEAERREALRAAVSERIAEARQAPANVQPSQAASSAAPAHPNERELRNLDENRQVVMLAKFALQDGVETAVHLAQRVGSSYVIDALHDLLTDRLLAVIAQRRAVKKQ